jgi:hypothetical protein
VVFWSLFLLILAPKITEVFSRLTLAREKLAFGKRVSLGFEKQTNLSGLSVFVCCANMDR